MQGNKLFIDLWCLIGIHKWCPWIPMIVSYYRDKKWIPEKGWFMKECYRCHKERWNK